MFNIFTNNPMTRWFSIWKKMFKKRLSLNLLPQIFPQTIDKLRSKFTYYKFLPGKIIVILKRLLAQFSLAKKKKMNYSTIQNMFWLSLIYRGLINRKKKISLSITHYQISWQNIPSLARHDVWWRIEWRNKHLGKPLFYNHLSCPDYSSK